MPPKKAVMFTIVMFNIVMFNIIRTTVILGRGQTARGLSSFGMMECYHVTYINIPLRGLNILYYMHSRFSTGFFIFNL